MESTGDGSTGETREEFVGLKTKVGILVEDAMNRRLVEAACLHLELVPTQISVIALGELPLHEFELLIADETIALALRQELPRDDDQTEGVNPAVILVRRPGLEAVQTPVEGKEPHLDGVLVLPQEPAAIVKQLGLLLYAHRAFAKRYQSALDELRLSRRIFRSVTSGISVANAKLPDHPLVYVNPAFEVMTGYSLEEVQGHNCRFLQNGETEQPGLTVVREALRDQREVVAVIRNYRKDGTWFWNELSLSWIRNKFGETTHLVGIQNDVTARVEFELKLRESEKLAAVGRLAASIAHEINNPLESVMNLLYLAQRSEDRPAVAEYLAQADRELRRVSLITSQSLRFYRQSSKAQAMLSSDLLESVLDVYQGRIGNAGVKVERRERMTQSIVCMESEIRQVVSNLVRNAIDSMHGTEGSRLVVRTREATEWRSEARGVILTIADTGQGMSAETRSKLYTAFYTTKGIGGTGLGLWVSAEIVDRHKGRLLVRSSQRAGANGTVFQLFLPYQRFAN